MSNREFSDYVKLSSAEREELLQRLDGAATRPRGRSRRTDTRLPFRIANVPILIAQPGKVFGRFLVVTRNISGGGLAFVHGSYVHPGTRCHITLPECDGGRAVLKGVTVSCRHVSGMLHEVGLRFDARIDVRRFIADTKPTTDDDAALDLPALEGHALLVAPAGTEDTTALTMALHAAGMSVAPAPSAPKAAEQIQRIPPDVVIYDARLETPIPAIAAGTLRDAGLSGLLLAIDPLDEKRTGPEAAFDAVCLSARPDHVLHTIADALASRPPDEARPAA